MLSINVKNCEEDYYISVNVQRTAGWCEAGMDGYGTRLGVFCLMMVIYFRAERVIHVTEF